MRVSIRRLKCLRYCSLYFSIKVTLCSLSVGTSWHHYDSHCAFLTASQNLLCSSNQAKTRFCVGLCLQTKCYMVARVIVLAVLYSEPSTVLKRQLLTTDMVQCCMSYLLIWPNLSDIILRYYSTCSACPVCVLKHEKMGLYRWSYLFLLLYSCSCVDAAFDPRADDYKRKGVLPVGVS